MLQYADQEAGHDVDPGDQDAGHRIALREPRSAVHRAVELGFGRQLLAPPLGFGLVDQPGVQVRIDGHLLARQRVQREARRHFGNAHRAVVDHHVLDGDQHQENHGADDVIAAHHETAECPDHLARRRRAGVAVQQDQPRGGDIQRQPEKRQQQQRGRERRELHRPHQVKRHHQHHDREQDVGGDQQIQHEARQRRDQRDDDAQHRQRHGHLTQRRERQRLEPFRQARFRECLRRCHRISPAASRS